MSVRMRAGAIVALLLALVVVACLAAATATGSAL